MKRVSVSVFAVAFVMSGYATAAAAKAPPPPPPPTACALTDIVPNALACAGFFDGNLLSSSPSNLTAQQNALASIGLNLTLTSALFNSFEKIPELGGSQTVNFVTPLNGITFFGIHFGNGQGGPGNGTAFYKLDAGVNLDTVQLHYLASSDAVLYSTEAPPPVPEPATWAMMLGGLGVVGFAMRRRSVKARVNFA